MDPVPLHSGAVVSQGQQHSSPPLTGSVLLSRYIDIQNSRTCSQTVGSNRSRFPLHWNRRSVAPLWSQLSGPASATSIRVAKPPCPLPHPKHTPTRCTRELGFHEPTAGAPSRPAPQRANPSGRSAQPDPPLPAFFFLSLHYSFPPSQARSVSSPGREDLELSSYFVVRPLRDCPPLFWAPWSGVSTFLASYLS